MCRDSATQSQVLAANPIASTWLSANAGSGKTKVLTDRVALLLLNGAAPENILCLTYTKAAATEMQNRLFRLLGAWAMKEDDALYKNLLKIGSDVHNDPEKLRRARTLFARAIETPGGLKIQTIHSFCASLLRRFPLEAGVSPQFSEIEDRIISQLIQSILEDLANSKYADLVWDLAKYTNDHSVLRLLTSILSIRQNFAFPSSKPEIWASFGLPAQFSERNLIADYLVPQDIDLVQIMAAEMAHGSVTDQKGALILQQVKDLTARSLSLMQQVFLNKSAPFAAKFGKLPTKALSDGILAPYIDQINDLIGRVYNAKQASLSLYAAQKSHALHRLAEVFLPEYERQKQLRGWLDFDDLILKTRDLLSKTAVADWVLYRLDGGISHILVDEAQDTSPLQWEVIEKLTREIRSGAGTETEPNRTIFIVGDKKQSIYSFQGADSGEFDRVKKIFSNQLSLTNTPLNDRILEYSFRSSSAILRTVDMTFQNKDSSGFSVDQKHISFKSDMPGRVDLWPPVETVVPGNDTEWQNPVDLPSQSNHFVVLAYQIAKSIKEMIDAETLLPNEIANSGRYNGRVVQPGDFLILVQKRSELFNEIIRACKSFELPITGADRLKVGAELAVKDLIALFSFLATPEDNLSLAVVLKSPLFGWTEQKLYTLAEGRGEQYLWQRLRDDTELYKAELFILNDLLYKTDFLRPYDLLERVLTKHEGRKKLLARLGNEAEDGINALLTQALKYEHSEIPSLTGFLVWVEVDDLEIKRQIDSDGDRIRVMTVHGAKGLESPIVILPDTTKSIFSDKNEILTNNANTFWKPRLEAMPSILCDFVAQKRVLDLQERDRLLYVAMTRAENWLIVAAAGELGGDPPCWYDQVKAGLRLSGATEYQFNFGKGLRLSNGDWPALEKTQKAVGPIETVKTPDWVLEPPPEPVMAEEALNPSGLGGAKVLSGDLGQDEIAAKRRGNQIHFLLERLPNIDVSLWENLAQVILENEGLAKDSENVDDIISETFKVLLKPELSFLFGPNTFAEVSVSALLPEYENKLLNGIIDRLIITRDEIIIVDYKTNRHVPIQEDDVPEGLMRQMGAYASAISQIYPSHRVRPCILWTWTGELLYLKYFKVIECLKAWSDA